MPSIKDLKKRIGTVKNTQQTTRAMKMVSAAKLRRAQDAILGQRPYALHLDALIRLAVVAGGESFQSPLLGRGTFGEAQGKKVLLILITSDRGLCGAFNSNIIRSAQRWVAAHAGEYDSVDLGFLGRKGYDFFKTKLVKPEDRQAGRATAAAMGPYYADLGGKVTVQKAKKLAESLIEAYLSGQYDEVKVVYNEFKNAVSQRVVVENFLPLTGDTADATQTKGEAASEQANYLIRPSGKVLLEQLLSKQFTAQAFRMMLESQASEHGARMSSMENATKNAGEMIRKLSLAYNKQRQAGITKELLEIIAGSESQKTAS